MLLDAERTPTPEGGFFNLYLNWCSDALLVATKTFSLFPAHGLEHFVPNIVTVEAIFGGLFIVTVQEKDPR